MDTETKTPIGLAFIAPSITPLVHKRHQDFLSVNPSFRSYSYDHINRTIINYKQYYAPLDIINLKDDEDDEGKLKTRSVQVVLSKYLIFK